MKKYLLLVLIASIATASTARAGQQVWQVVSPDHGQTYAYGSEQDHSWAMAGPDHHLILRGTYTNGPWAQGGATRTDYFTFNFPKIKLGPGGHTFFYHTSSGLDLVVARRQSGFLGIMEIKLLPTAYLATTKRHGYLTQTIVVGVAPFAENPDWQIGFSH